MVVPSSGYFTIQNSGFTNSFLLPIFFFQNNWIINSSTTSFVFLSYVLLKTASVIISSLIFAEIVSLGKSV